MDEDMCPYGVDRKDDCMHCQLGDENHWDVIVRDCVKRDKAPIWAV